MIYFTDAEIDQLINEDLPYYDLTSISIKMGTKVARITSYNVCYTKLLRYAGGSLAVCCW